MSLISEPTEVDVRAQILTAAERLFREVGYQKTTVADIAKSLRMSPANIYRFFDSKKSIHEGVARHLMGEVEAAADAISKKQASPSVRLRELLVSVHHMNSERYVGDAKLHEMVAIAMEESWDVCQAHIECINGTIANVIADGVAAGEFHVADVPLAAQCTCSAMMRFFHPQMIAECMDKPGPTLDQMIDFIVAGLSNNNTVP